MTLANIMGMSTYLIYRWAWVGVDWLYPPTCGGCGESGERWCTTCNEVTRLIHPPFCCQCGRQLNAGDKCYFCDNQPPTYVSMRSWAVYEGSLRNAIQRLKYKGDVALGDVLAVPLSDILLEEEWDVDLVTPVPMERKRVAERGYNQAALLALPLALKMKLTYRPQALKKVRVIVSQVGLSLEDRLKNVRGAFRADDKIVHGKSVLVVDDVVTSGATINECAEALMNAGARCVFGITLARAGGY